MLIMNSCSIIPKVKNKDGKDVDSKLFSDLLSFTTRETTKDVYSRVKSEDFTKRFLPILSLDLNGEPLLSSLFEKLGLFNMIPKAKVIEVLLRKMGMYKRGSNDLVILRNNDKNYRALLDKVIEFNQNSEFKNIFTASVIKVYYEESGGSGISIDLLPANSYNALNNSKALVNRNLNDKLREILSSMGISVGALTELEERLGINGVSEFDTAKVTAEGTIELIRLAKGTRGEQALPEEFSHIILEALKDHPLVQRLLKFIEDNNLVTEILKEEFEDYARKYNNDTTKLTKEAAGKLLAKHLLKNEEIPTSKYKNLLERVIQAVKDFFSKFSTSEIQKAIIQADKEFSDLANQIVGGELNSYMKIENLNSKESLFNLGNRVKRDKELLQKIIDNEVKRLHIYSARIAGTDSTFDIDQEVFIGKLNSELQTNNELAGIFLFLENAVQEMGKIHKRLSTLQTAPPESINEKARVLRDVRNYLYSYKNIASELRHSLLEEEKYEDNRYGNKARVALDQLNVLLEDAFLKYNGLALPTFTNFVKNYTGDSINFVIGKWKGKTITVDDIIKGYKKSKVGDQEIIEWFQEDISFFDRWLDSMADSSDFVLKVLDQAIKGSKEKSRLSTINDEKLIKALAVRLEQAGITNTDWMFERNEKGELTGKYISKIDYKAFNKAKKEFFDNLNKKYGTPLIGQAQEDYRKEFTQWYEDNTIKGEDDTTIPNDKYLSKEYKSLNSAQRDYFNGIMAIKERLDSYLPDGSTVLRNTVKIRKDLLERVKSSDGVVSGGKQIWEAVKDQFLRRSDDSEFGSSKAVIDFEGREVQALPIYYLKTKAGENPNDVSTDVTSTLIAYAAMANDFREMNKVVHILELSRDMMYDRKLLQSEGGKTIKETFNAAGIKVESFLTKSNKKDNVTSKLDDMYSMQVYNRFMADEGTFKGTNIDKGKAANVVNRITALNSLALNLLSGIANVTVGSVMMNIEAFCKEFFTPSHLLRADNIYRKYLPGVLGELGNRVKVNKLSLWNEYFNTLQEYEQDIQTVNWDRKTWFSRMFGSSSLFFINNAGEHWMQTRTSLALAESYEMRDASGNIVSLWDAMEVVPINKNNPKEGAKLKVKEGYTKKDGTEFTEKDAIEFSRKAAAINERMHGIYNKVDRNAVQRLAIGRMGMMYRKWIKPSLNRRFASAEYNYDLKEWTEGYYLTTWNFLKTIATDLREGQLNLMANYDKLDKREKNNIKRALIEVGHFIAVAIILGAVDFDDEDENRSWMSQITEYQLRRMYTELGALIPTPFMANEALKILESPAAGVDTIEKTLNLIKLLNPYNYEAFGGEDAIIKSGRHKGKSRAYKIFYDAPLIPTNKTIYRVTHPEELIPFYKQ